MAATREDVKFLSNPKIGLRRKKYCRFRKFGIKYIDYKDADFLLQFINEQGKLLPRRILTDLQVLVEDFVSAPDVLEHGRPDIPLSGARRDRLKRAL